MNYYPPFKPVATPSAPPDTLGQFVYVYILTLKGRLCTCDSCVCCCASCVLRLVLSAYCASVLSSTSACYPVSHHHHHRHPLPFSSSKRLCCHLLAPAAPAAIHRHSAVVCKSHLLPPAIICRYLLPRASNWYHQLLPVTTRPPLPPPAAAARYYLRLMSGGLGLVPGLGAVLASGSGLRLVLGLV
jgi:hypothetical protein